ncbi:GAF and ANTAR domain-containing protein [Blastococcus sp. TF02A-30]|uniref:GAF and ANTAR domain-containing protein n=1 Tax=Blastococcus sp. TF02A-30 TaxID=2250580 RepID=UPI000DE836D1|nr:GAF and ANTAR domain-containing protein [Blastococcus sp. TF02A-30]RBY87807.1 response regulator receiver protein [Blastococcus sp. TF02A-30]
MTSGDTRSPNQPSEQNAGASENEDDLARRLAAAARDMQELSGPQQVMDHLVHAAVALVPGAEAATITFTEERTHVVSAAATGNRARKLDELHDEVEQGPCLDAVFEQEVVRVDDLPGDGRWPELGRRAHEIDVVSLLCLRLFVHGANLGALNMLSSRPSAFDDESETVGLLFVSHAAVAVADARQLEHLHVALAGRDLIGQAKGILMERFKIPAEQAFALLSRVSQDSNRKLRDVAEELTRTGSIGG